MIKFPVKIPKGTYVTITQGFQPPENPTHDAIDFVISKAFNSQVENQRLSYGTQLVCPVKEAKVTRLNDFGTMNTLGNGIDIEWFDGTYWWNLHYWHTVYNERLVGDTVHEGDTVALMGNTGDCRPPATAEEPYQGTHCHLRMSRYTKNQYGGNVDIVSVDPRFFLDVTSPYYGDDFSNTTTDLIPLNWAFQKLNLVSNFEKLMYFLKNIAK